MPQEIHTHGGKHIATTSSTTKGLMAAFTSLLSSTKCKSVFFHLGQHDSWAATQVIHAIFIVSVTLTMTDNDSRRG